MKKRIRYRYKGNTSIHRLIWMEHNGEIPLNHHVHHINGDPFDNRIENLMLCNRQDHSRIHDKRYEKINGAWYRICSACKELLPVTSFYFRVIKKRNFPSISSSCKRCRKKYFNDRNRAKRVAAAQK